MSERGAADGRESKPWLWKPGQSGNPAGRPPVARSFADLLRAELALEKAGQTNRAAIAAKAVQMARAGNLEAMKWVADRTDGKVPERLELEAEHVVTIDDALRLEVLAYAARQRALGRGA